jgi:hypothetical protein
VACPIIGELIISLMIRPENTMMEIGEPLSSGIWVSLPKLRESAALLKFSLCIQGKIGEREAPYEPIEGSTRRKRSKSRSLASTDKWSLFRKDCLMQVITPNEHREGPVARAIEQQTAKLPSDTFLWMAGGCIASSLALKIMGRDHDSEFVGQWVPTLLILGLYNKLVKVAGSD